MSLNLTAKQREALDLLNGKQRNTLLVGGSRSGKTFLFCTCILVRAIKAVGSRHGIFRLRSNSVWSSIGLDTLPKVARILEIPVKQNKVDRFFSTPEHRVGSSFQRSEIWLAGTDEKERSEKVLGFEFVTIYENESSQIPYSSHLMLVNRLAQVCDGIEQRHYADLNPSGKTHWTNRLFIEKVDPIARTPVPDPQNYAHMFVNPSSNAQNLSVEYLNSLQYLPERQRKRFYEGVYVDQIDNALWTFETIDRVRIDGIRPDRVITVARGEGKDYRMPTMKRIVVAIDPSGTAGSENQRSDEVGIVVCGMGTDGKGYILEDLTCNLGPAGWARVAVNAYHTYNADKIVAEMNFGGAMVESTIRNADKTAAVKMVVASKGKAQRAEPIAALFDEQIDKVRLVGRWPLLEDQLTSFSTAGYMGERSPDRADACIWALSELFGVSAPGMGFFEYMKQKMEPDTVESGTPDKAA